MATDLMTSADLGRPFWDALGIDPSRAIEKLVITIERDRPVMVEIVEALTLPK